MYYEKKKKKKKTAENNLVEVQKNTIEKQNRKKK
jgi:hypothetical protein